MVMQGRDKGLRRMGRNRGSLQDRDNTRSSPHPSVITLGCLDGEDKRGEGEGCYSSQLSFKPDTDTVTR